MTDPVEPLHPATLAELEFALAYALRFDGRKHFKLSDEMMANITASHLAKYLQQSGFVVMKAPSARSHSSSGLLSPDAGHKKHLTE